jgi:hypothetical protein
VAAEILAHVDTWFVENVFKPLERDEPRRAIAYEPIQVANRPSSWRRRGSRWSRTQSNSMACLRDCPRERKPMQGNLIRAARYLRRSGMGVGDQRSYGPYASLTRPTMNTQVAYSDPGKAAASFRHFWISALLVRHDCGLRKLTSMAAPAIVLGGLFIASVAFAQQNPAPSAPMGSGSMQGSGMMQGGTMSGSGGTQPSMQDCQKMMSGGSMSGMSGDMKAMMDRCNEMMKQGGQAGAPMLGK